MPERGLNKGTSSFQVVNDKWIPSRFNVRARADDGTLLLYNSYTGAMGGVPSDKE